MGSKIKLGGICIMFKKLLVVSLVACMALFAGNAVAGGWGIPIGHIDENVAADNQDRSKAIDFHLFRGPAGIAIGGGSINGYGEARADGLIVNGSISADISATGGGNSQSGRTDNLGTWTQNHAETGAFVDLSASARFGIGGVSADASGYAEQHSLNTGGGIANHGLTGGIAGQESSGGFEGDAKVAVLFRGSPTAGFNAHIQMDGGSWTDSYKTRDGLGTSVEAYTTVQSIGGSYDNGFVACADVNGGFSASGKVSTTTIQPGAFASANGSYSGAASLGKTYTGQAIGYSETANYGNGVNQAWAGMSVTSTVTRTLQ